MVRFWKNMKFDKGIAKKYRKSIERALATIIEKGNDGHRRVANAILDSKMTICVHPVSKVNASGITGLIDLGRTNKRIAEERLNVVEALKEVFITIAEETIDNGGQRGCEGTLVHEGRHAYDYGRAIESYSNADINPLGLFDPNGFELEWAAHVAAAEYMLLIGKDEYIKEGLDLMVLCSEDGECAVYPDGIKLRLKNSYGTDPIENPGTTMSQNWGLMQKQ
jgi:hypothetical protein